MASGTPKLPLTPQSRWVGRVHPGATRHLGRIDRPLALPNFPEPRSRCASDACIRSLRLRLGDFALAGPVG